MDVDNGQKLFYPQKAETVLKNLNDAIKFRKNYKNNIHSSNQFTIFTIILPKFSIFSLQIFEDRVREVVSIIPE